MSSIVAGRFDRTLDADAALQDLKDEGFAATEVQSFYVSPPGQHDRHVLGGDSHSDAGATKAGWGAAIGAIVGVVVGLAAGTLTSGEFGLVAVLLGAGLGAYIGSFAGTMAKLRGVSRRGATTEHPDEPLGGRMIAINVDRPQTDKRAASVLHRHGARDIGRAKGEWRDGSWRDFDPRAPLGAL